MWQVASRLRAYGIEVESYPGNVLYEPQEARGTLSLASLAVFCKDVSQLWTRGSATHRTVAEVAGQGPGRGGCGPGASGRLGGSQRQAQAAGAPDTLVRGNRI